MRKNATRPRFMLGSALFTFATLSACGGSQTQEPKDPSQDNDSGSRPSDLSQIGMSAEIGALPEAETDYAFKQAFKGIEACLLKASQRIEFFGGEFAVKVHVGSDGQAEKIFAERSTLGDSETEQCMFKVLRGAPWPKPVGGSVGIAQNSFEFEMTGDVRPPVAWSQANVQSTLDQNHGAISECKGSLASVSATLYVDTEGQVLGVGVSGSDPGVEDARACLVQVLTRATFPSPGSWPAKVSVEL